MFKPDISTITQNMHKVSLQNYATALSHQRGQKCWRPSPLSYKHAVLAAFPNPARICTFCVRRKSSDLLADICMKQAPGGGLRTMYLLFCREPQYSLHASALRRTHHSPLPPYFFWLWQKNILNGNFPRKLHQSQVMPKRRHLLLKG